VGAAQVVRAWPCDFTHAQDLIIGALTLVAKHSSPSSAVPSPLGPQLAPGRHATLGTDEPDLPNSGMTSAQRH
jgi:hypothetical protein